MTHPARRRDPSRETLARSGPENGVGSQFTMPEGEGADRAYTLALQSSLQIKDIRQSHDESRCVLYYANDVS